jgi:hypothetical protein
VPLSWNLGTLTSWNPLGHSKPVTGLLYLTFFCTWQYFLANQQFQKSPSHIVLFVTVTHMPVAVLRKNIALKFQYLYNKIIRFFCGSPAQLGLRPPKFEFSRSHTIRHTRINTRYDCSEQVISCGLFAHLWNAYRSSLPGMNMTNHLQPHTEFNYWYCCTSNSSLCFYWHVIERPLPLLHGNSICRNESKMAPLLLKIKEN